MKYFNNIFNNFINIITYSKTGGLDHKTGCFVHYYNFYAYFIPILKKNLYLCEAFLK
jgi:hypothetical protein